MTPSAAQDEVFGRLKIQLSPARLAPYLKAQSGDLGLAIAHYYWNVELCRAYYPVLQAVEVALRNNIDRSFSTVLGPAAFHHIDSWLDRVTPVLVQSEAIVSKAKSKLLRDDGNGGFLKNPNIGHGDLVAALSFGFWEGLLGEAYETAGPARIRFWPDHMKAVFPGAGGTMMTSVRVRFTALRHFRNRVFHHEPLWQKSADKPSPRDQYDSALLALRWLAGFQYSIPSNLHGPPQILEAQEQVPAMLKRLLKTVDTILERGKRKKQGPALPSVTTMEQRAEHQEVKE